MTSDLSDRLPSRPLRNWFLAWHITTGDPIETIAKGFDLPVELVAELVEGTGPLMLATEEALRICRAARLDPSELWLLPGHLVESPPHAIDPVCSELGALAWAGSPPE